MHFFCFIFFYLIAFLFLLGIVFIVTFLVKKSKDKTLLYVGIILCSIPLIINYLGYFQTLFLKTPNAKELVGIYKISKESVTSIDDNTIENYSLQFYDNGTFTITPIDEIDCCESGKYKVNLQLISNEISLDCVTYSTTASIEKRIGNFAIVFTIGDPDGGETVVFEKE